MANQSLFSSHNSNSLVANTSNSAGGPAYQMCPKHALAQFAATGTFGNVFYSDAKGQLNQFQELANQVNDPQFLAKLAIYSRQKAFMKDMPAAIVTMLSVKDSALMHQVFDKVIDNGRMLRNVFQMTRSGQFGRRGLSSSLQRAFRRWFNEAPAGRIVNATIGNEPTLRDILRMARPKPKDNCRRALFGWICGKDPSSWAPASIEDLPKDVAGLIAFREAEDSEAKIRLIDEMKVRWDLLTGPNMDSKVWKAIVRQMGPQAIRMNLNTMIRHGVFKNADAAEISCGNIPEFPGPIVIGVDTSGSMQFPVTGYHGRAKPSKMRCVDAAALFAAAIVRKNPDSVIVPFDTRAHSIKIDSQDTILSIAERLSKIGGGGTDCSIPLSHANTHLRNRPMAGVVIVSDNESWMYQGKPHYFGSGVTGVMEQWKKFVSIQKKNGIANPKMVCIDILAGTTTQAPERKDILNVGGFSDAVFRVVNSFLRSDSSRFVSEVEAIEL